MIPDKGQGAKAKRVNSDNLCKELAERYPEQFVRWLFGVGGKVKVLKTELSREPIRADSVILSGSTGELFHIEFQTTSQSKVPLPLRMLDYYVGLKRKHCNRRIRQVLIVLKQTGEEIAGEYRDEQVRFTYSLIKMWEQEAQEVMKYEGLLPLATLCRTPSSASLLSAITAKIRKLKSKEQRRETITFSQVLAGLRYNKADVYQLLKEGEMLEESSVYQDILQKGVRKGLQQGRQQGVQQGVRQGVQIGERNVILRQLTKLLGRLSPKVRKQIDNLSAKQLEHLADDLLGFKTKNDLSAWLNKNASAH